MSEDEERNSEKSVTKADAGDKSISCGAWTFPWMTLVSLYRLTVYINKLFQDGQAVSVYYKNREVIYCIASVSCLLVPAFVYMFFLLLSHIKREDNIKKREAGTKIVDGLLLIPWQIRSIVEVLHFSAQRVCQRRPPSEDEELEHSLIERRANVLEFFENFFAGFIQLLLQIYILLMYHDISEKGYWDPERPYNVLFGEIVASGLTLLSMLLAVQRKDDGPFFTIISFCGWSAVMSSRVFTLALAASVIHIGILGFCLLHAIAITLWITPICWRTYSELSKQRKCATAFLVFFLFGLPSLVYWPIMFQLKANKRPHIFLAIITIENAGLFCIWYFMKEQSPWSSYSTMCLAVVAGGTCAGCLFLLIYISLKPKYTDDVVLHDMRTSNAESCGMYYDFYEITFQLCVTPFVEKNIHHVRNTNV